MPCCAPRAGRSATLVAGVRCSTSMQASAAGGKESLAIEVTFQPRERTLTEAEIEAASAQKVVAAVAKATGAVLR